MIMEFNIEDALYDIDIKDSLKEVQNITELITTNLIKYHTISKDLLTETEKIKKDNQWSSEYKTNKILNLEIEKKAQINNLNEYIKGLLAKLQSSILPRYNDEQKNIHLKNMEVIKVHDLVDDKDKLNAFISVLKKKDILTARSIFKKVYEENNPDLVAKFIEEFRKTNFGIAELGVEEVINLFNIAEKSFNNPSNAGYEFGAMFIENIAKKMLKAVGVLEG